MLTFWYEHELFHISFDILTSSQWQHSEDDSDKASVQEKKIRVVYLSVGGAAPANLTPMKNGTDGTVSVRSSLSTLQI